MEQPCYKCGQAVEQGIAFCPHCAAPQIRVLIAEATPAAAAFAETAPTQAAVPIPGSQQLPLLPGHWSQAIRPCALAAFVASLFMTLGLNPFVAMLSVGFLAVIFYRQRRPGLLLKPFAGARLGALGGLLWFAMSTILESVVVLALHKGPEIRAAVLAKIDEAAARTSDPQALAMLAHVKTPGGLEVLMICGIIFTFVASIVLSGLGGALGGAIFGRRDKG